MQKYAINRQIWRCKAESLNIITLTNVKTDVLMYCQHADLHGNQTTPLCRYCQVEYLGLDIQYLFTSCHRVPIAIISPCVHSGCVKLN